MSEVGQERGTGGEYNHRVPDLEEPERHPQTNGDADHGDHHLETEREDRQVDYQTPQTQNDKDHDVERWG